MAEVFTSLLLIVAVAFVAPLISWTIPKRLVPEVVLLILGVSLITFVVCCINPNAISMIYAISGPLIAMILFIMPTLSTYLIPSLKPYRSIGNLLTLIVGVLCVSVMFVG